MTDRLTKLQLQRRPLVMGVLNLTPDSFSDGGRFDTRSRALRRIEEMAAQGAAIIDIGGESTRPGSEPVPAAEEIRRVQPVFDEAVKAFPDLLFSADTMKADVAKAALDAGAHIVNDVSGLQRDPEKARLAAEYGAALVIMHAQGVPKTMQQNPQYEDVVAEVRQFLETQAAFAAQAGVKYIITDPGIGFGKTTEHNLALFAGLPELTRLPYPLLMGASRKSLIGHLLDARPVDGRLAGTLALHYHALMAGAGIIRVHDVQEASDSIRIFTAIRDVSPGPYSTEPA
ncbi:Dihydropteroate synthase [Cyclonatronum proteinivorum]|uniref:Dihydropteroate synthase n=1 Tax=Cyclonatronum proteinivorum TaxID=1457365 RepID=A0A345UPH9_9BACT|nr:dihydropteroate synthase [Cyclonatronum proteinivorum]AXJ02381.1 Dihydropteroate synthase [Cyclonatronum proteinivorum]